MDAFVVEAGVAERAMVLRGEPLGRSARCKIPVARASSRPFVHSAVLGEAARMAGAGAWRRTFSVLRSSLGRDLRDVARAADATVLHVTHDAAEALSLADRIVVLEDGRVVQDGAPEALVAAPATPFVARATGRTNLVPAARATEFTAMLGGDRGLIRLPSGDLTFAPDAIAAVAGDLLPIAGRRFAGTRWFVELAWNGIPIEAATESSPTGRVDLRLPGKAPG